MTIDLAKNQKALLPIVVPIVADRIVNFAAKELKSYLKKITGATFRVSSSAKTIPGIFLHVTEGQNDCGDGFSIKSSNRGIHICGNNSRSVLYGVYDLLETIGCLFAEPGIEYVPSCTNLKVKAGNKKEQAAFPLRNVFRNINARTKNAPFPFMNPDLVIPQIDWMAKKRLNRYEFYVDYYRFDLWEKYKAGVLDALLDRGFDLELTHHSIHYFCPPDANHDFGGYGPSTYVDKHPEWYEPSLECSDRGRWQTRVELPAVRKLIIDRFIDFYSRNMELKVVSLWPDDVPMNNPGKGLTPADGYLKTFWNPVSKQLAKALPKKQLGTIAYFELIKTPKKIKPYPNQHCWFCPISRDYRLPITASYNKHFIKDLRGWTKCMPPGRVGIFEYYGWSIPFIPFWKMMKEDLQVYQDCNVAGLYGWSGFSLNAMGENFRWALDLNVLAELQWNPKKKVSAIARDWGGPVYGKSAGSIMEFYMYLSRAFKGTKKEPLGPGSESCLPENKWVSVSILRKAQVILDKARKQATTPEIRRRIDLIEMVLAGTLRVEVPRSLPKGRCYWGM